MNFGDVLRNLLEEKEITQKQLAENLNIAPSTLGNYIRKLREPDYEMLKLFADYFQVTTDYLLSHKTNQAESQAEDELLRVFRSLTEEQQELYIEQGKLFIIYNNKKQKSSISTPENDVV